MIRKPKKTPRGLPAPKPQRPPRNTGRRIAITKLRR